MLIRSKTRSFLSLIHDFPSKEAPINLQPLRGKLKIPLRSAL